MYFNINTTNLLFKNSPFLNSLPINPKGIIIIIEIEGGTDKQNGIDGHRFDTIHICNALIGKNYYCIPIFYRDSLFDSILMELSHSNISVILPRVNPSVSPDFTQEKFFKLLNLLKKNGKFVLPNPNIMIKMGGKDSLVKIKNSIFGKKDTYAYYNLYDWNTTFIEDLKKNPFEKRVIKQNNGSQGEGIWMVHIEEPNKSITLNSFIIVQEARDNKIKKMSLKDFIYFCKKYYIPREGMIVNQKYLPKIKEGEIRLLLIKDDIVSIIKKVPATSGFSATLNSGAIYSDFKPTDKQFEELVKQFYSELPNLKALLNIDSLPLIWTADFIKDDPDENGNNKYIIGEFNCTCVGIKTVIDIVSPIIADKIDKLVY
jgi:glutathione synthase/RimK-type ligase-like ATP-grasp enzyme